MHQEHGEFFIYGIHANLQSMDFLSIQDEEGTGPNRWWTNGTSLRVLSVSRRGRSLVRTRLTIPLMLKSGWYKLGEAGGALHGWPWKRQLSLQLVWLNQDDRDMHQKVLHILDREEIEALEEKWAIQTEKRHLLSRKLRFVHQRKSAKESPQTRFFTENITVAQPTSDFKL